VLSQNYVIRLDNTNAVYRNDSCYPIVEYALS